jgi:hypothetical protein
MFSLPERIESKAIVFPSGDQLLSSLMVPMSFLGSMVCPATLFTITMDSVATRPAVAFWTEIMAIVVKEYRRR